LGSGVKENYYVLSGPEGAAPADSTGALAIYVGPVSVPESVDRSAMVLQNSANQVDLSDEHRWAEPVKTAIPRVIAKTSCASPTPLASWRAARSRHGRRLPRGARRAALRIVARPGRHRRGALDRHRQAREDARHGPLERAEPAASPTPEGVAAAHSRALARVASDIAAALK
jgi:hypothetical protein